MNVPAAAFVAFQSMSRSPLTPTRLTPGSVVISSRTSCVMAGWQDAHADAVVRLHVLQFRAEAADAYIMAVEQRGHPRDIAYGFVEGQAQDAVVRAKMGDDEAPQLA